MQLLVLSLATVVVLASYVYYRDKYEKNHVIC